MPSYYNGPKADPALGGVDDPVIVMAVAPGAEFSGAPTTDASLASRVENVRIQLGDGRVIEVPLSTISSSPQGET